jgi:hypothetical protein
LKKKPLFLKIVAILTLPNQIRNPHSIMRNWISNQYPAQGSRKLFAIYSITIRIANRYRPYPKRVLIILYNRAVPIIEILGHLVIRKRVG